MNYQDVLTKLPSALHWPARFCSFVTILTWILSLVTGNVSHVDRLWTFLPTIYATYYALLPLWPKNPTFFLCPYTPKDLGWTTVKDFSPRAVLMLVLVIIWMCRLTYNAYRRGILSLSEEDYRWAVLRARFPPWFFQVINLIFVAIIQNIFLFAISYPLKFASVDQPHAPLATSDIVLAVLAIITLLLEFISDNQQYSFQIYKKSYFDAKMEKKVIDFDPRKQWPGSRIIWTPADAQRGFITRGLWAFSRHPNIACEQFFWWIINLIPLVSSSSPNLFQGFEFSCLSSITTSPCNFSKAFSLPIDVLWNICYYTSPGLSLSLLFLSSTIFTESISMDKYPAYQAYCERVAMFGGPMTFVKRLRLACAGRGTDINSLLWSTDEKNKKE